MNRLVLITGGARSGKSTFAEKLAGQLHQRNTERTIAYIATGEAMDADFRQRIEKHRESRIGLFVTYEEPLELSRLMEKTEGKHSIFLLECLTTWLGNVFHHKGPSHAEAFTDHELGAIATLLGKPVPYNQSFPEILRSAENGKFLPGLDSLLSIGPDETVLIAVSNELGLGIVPADKESRAYRDIHGRMNQKMASMADYVYFTASGIPRRVK